MDKLFNVRVYGICINDQKEVLLTDEFRSGYLITKFPGGGLEHGEGTIDCLKRECLEELGHEVGVLDHFYTTDFYQQSVFNKQHQLLSIYYFIQLKAEVPVRKKFEFESKIEGAQLFRWFPLAELSEKEMTFPIDKYVVELLKKFKVESLKLKI